MFFAQHQTEPLGRGFVGRELKPKDSLDRPESFQASDVRAAACRRGQSRSPDVRGAFGLAVVGKQGVFLGTHGSSGQVIADLGLPIRFQLGNTGAHALHTDAPK